jgi:hypothetical protein
MIRMALMADQSKILCESNKRSVNRFLFWSFLFFLSRLSVAINSQPLSTISDSAQPTLRRADVARRNNPEKFAQRHGAERFLNEELPYLSNSNQ